LNALPRISVVIPTYQRRDAVERLLWALAGQSLAPEAFEVVVVVDGSEDGTPELVEAFPAPYTLRVFCQTNQGRSCARNVGVSHAQGEIVVFLDDDMEPVPGCLEAHAFAHCGSLRVAVVGAAPVSLGPSSSPIQVYAGELFNRYYGQFADAGRRFDYLDFYSGNFSIRRCIHQEVGGFDETFTTYGNEDTEFSLRLARLGVSLVYDPAAAACQSCLKDFSSFAHDTIAMGSTAVLLAVKHPGVWRNLKLGTFRQTPLMWRFVRAGLLTLGRLVPPTPEMVIRLAGTFTPRRPRWRNLYFKYVLDYCFWIGVRKVLVAHPNGPDPFCHEQTSNAPGVSD